MGAFFTGSFGLFVLLLHVSLAGLMTISLFFSPHPWSKIAKVVCLVMIWTVPILGTTVYILSYFYAIFFGKSKEK